MDAVLTGLKAFYNRCDSKSGLYGLKFSIKDCRSKLLHVYEQCIVQLIMYHRNDWCSIKQTKNH